MDPTLTEIASTLDLYPIRVPGPRFLPADCSKQDACRQMTNDALRVFAPFLPKFVTASTDDSIQSCISGACGVDIFASYLLGEQIKNWAEVLPNSPLSELHNYLPMAEAVDSAHTMWRLAAPLCRNHDSEDDRVPAFPLPVRRAHTLDECLDGSKLNRLTYGEELRLIVKRFQTLMADTVA